MNSTALELTDWRATLDAIPGMAYTLTPSLQIEFVNKYTLEYTGIHDDAVLLGDAWMSVIHPDDLPALQLKFAEILENELPYDLDVRVRKADGIYHWFRAKGSPARDADGRIARWFAFGVETEEHVQAITALRESDERLRTFVQSIPQILWTADASGFIEWYNSRWEEYTGQTPAESAGWGWQAAHHPEDFPAVMEQWPHSIATGEPFEMEFRLRGRDGEFQWFLTRIVPQHDDAGEVVRWYGSNTNINLQKRDAQRSARVAQTLQEAILPDRLPVGEAFRFDAVYLPAESDAYVGGDWYDALRLPDGRLLISCGDVAGHGLEAAVLAGRLRQSITVTGAEDASPARILDRVNRIALLQNSVIATVVVAVFDPLTLTLSYALAGHPPPCIASPNTAALLPAGELPIGVTLATRWEEHTVVLEPDSVVIFYTDGVTEFGRDILTAEQKLIEAALLLVRDTNNPRPALTVMHHVLKDATPVDDIAIVVMQCSHVATTPLHFDDTERKKKWRFHSSDPLTAQQSRRTLVEYLEKVDLRDGSMYEAELIIGEAIANTVEHAPGLVEITIDWDADRPTFIIRDTGPGLIPRVASLPSDEMSEDGRGMFLIHALASDVCVSRAPGFGSEIRCTLPLYRSRP